MSDHIWNAIDTLTDEDRALGAPQLAELRGPIHDENGKVIPIGDSLDWLRPHLEAFNREGRSVGDVANEFCVKYGTMRSWYRRLGVKPLWNSRGNSRVWCDIQHKFVPVTGKMGKRLGIRAPQPQNYVPADHARMAKMRTAAIAAKKRNRAAFCLRGHALTPENRSTGVDGRLGGCLECARRASREHQRTLRAKRKAAA